MNIKKIGLLLILATCCSFVYFLKKNTPEIEQSKVIYSSQEGNSPVVNVAPKGKKSASCDCSTAHTCDFDMPNPIKASYKTRVLVPPSSEVIPKREKKAVVKKTKKRLNRKQAFVPKSLKEGNSIKGKTIVKALKTENIEKDRFEIKENNLERYNRKSAFPYINVMTCTSSRSKKYHEKMCRGIKKCSTSIDTMKAFEAEKKGLEPCKICFKNLKNK